MQLRSLCENMSLHCASSVENKAAIPTQHQAVVFRAESKRQIFPLIVGCSTFTLGVGFARRHPIMSNINRAAEPGTSRPMRRDPVSLETIPVNQESAAPPSRQRRTPNLHCSTLQSPPGKAPG